MAVTKQTYTATATWTASQLAGIFETAFIDAGLMTAWYDSFLSGSIENRILQVVNDGAKTYGTVYYWFMFTTSGFYLHTALDWNASTHVPQGTQYEDYYSTTTNSTTNHVQLNSSSISSSVTTTLTRYTSAVDSDVTWFLLRNGSANRAFMIPSPGFNALSFVDQDKMAFNAAIALTGSATNNYAWISVFHVAAYTRATYLGAVAMRSVTTASYYRRQPNMNKIIAAGNATNSTSNWVGDDNNTFAGVSGLILPGAAANTNSELAADHFPVFTGPQMIPYMPALPSDFGFVAYYAASNMAVQDKFIVTASSEEWEIIAAAINTGSTSAGRVLFMARVV